ncbi:MAG: tRNA (guanosine(46)-N7)-methyltransferase TrmB [Spirochaetales bacterium]|nr:tRNA (guanosine(46)-N7)-methyltransferase TrmB [Spirochaetales bacterium]MCF7938418.1 tRNA (guanosine(46)-N7)-methyltransferase TrmB [Spirochaetales bacterium]
MAEESCFKTSKNEIKSFVVRGGRITNLQQRALEEFGPRYIIPDGSGPADFDTIFPGEKNVYCEIGFGMGLATAELAEKQPEAGFIGIEVFPAGIGKLLSEIGRRGLENIRIFRGDAVQIVKERIGPETITGFHVFFPDPWPKKRHHKRRLIQPQFAGILAERLQPGGYLYVVTDWQDYAQHILRTLEGENELVNSYAENDGGFAEPQHWRPTTKFEKRGMKKEHQIFEIVFRKPGPALPAAGR